jgi:hypothetical protein
MTHQPARLMPEPFAAIDEVGRLLCAEVMDLMERTDEVTRTPEIEDIETGQLWSRASGGWRIDFECDIDNANSQGRLPKCLADEVEAQQMEALLSWVDHEHPEWNEELEAIRHPRNLRSLYEYAATYLGKTKAQVDADIRSHLWRWYHDELTDEEREDFHEHEREWISGSYIYALEIAYLRTTDIGNRHDEAVIEIACTFRASELSTQHDIATLTILPSAFSEGLCEMLANWAVSRFMDQ